MNNETKLVIELWDYIRDNLSAKLRADAALHILKLFEEYGVDVDRNELEGEDEYLDDALHILQDDHEEAVDEWNENDRD